MSMGIRRFLPTFAVGLGSLLAVASALASTPGALFDDFWEFHMKEDPGWASYLGDHRYSAGLRDESARAEARRFEAATAFLDRARKMDRSDIEKSDLLSLLLLERKLHESIDDYAHRTFETPLTQQSGLHVGFPQIVHYHPVGTEKGVRDFVLRLRVFPSRVEQVVANMRTGAEAGNVSYRGVVEKVIAQVRLLAESDPTAHPLAEIVERFGDSIEEPLRSRLEGEVHRAIEVHAIPAYQFLLSFLQVEYLPASRNQPGIHALPRGRERYEYLARRYTTTELSPSAIHQLGLEEMARIRQDMHAVMARVDFEGTLDQFFEFLRKDARFYHESKEALMAEFRSILVKMDAKMPELFGRLPQTPYDLKEIEEFRAPAAPAAYYYSAPADGSRPGYFYVNTYDLPSRPRYTMEALAYHEAVPGHHLQLALQQELDLPDFRRHSGFTAFVEGWGLYSERLPLEVGLYSDPYSEFGRLTFEAWRASRLVVDTGIHSMGWERQRAVDYLVANTALALHDIESEVDRYIAWPGQALAYKVGEIRIREIRARAEEELGERFDVREFHDALLENGAVPLDVLEQVMTDWTRERLAAP